MTRGETWLRLVELGAVKGEVPEGRWDFSGANLSGVDLIEAKLSRAKLSRVDLSGADLIEADLSRADLWRADLSRANLSEADLNEADLIRANLSRAKLSRANLSGANLSRANLSEANLSEADLSRADLGRADLSRANLNEANLNEADLIEADLIEANLIEADLIEAYLSRANLWKAKLSRADLSRADLSGADFSGANLSGANLSGANLSGANFSEADLTGANLTNALLVEVNLEKAKLNNCQIHGVSAWDLRLQDAEQTNLIITPEGQPVITVDNLKVAQFIYLLLNNPEVREVIDSITSKVVLILGRFTPERKVLLDALRNELRQRNYTPVLFDFEGAETHDIAVTVSTLARMARFVIADITNAKSISQELMDIVPHLPSVPVQPILQGSLKEHGSFEHFKRYSWVLPIYHYTDISEVLPYLSGKIILPAETKAEEQRKR